MKKSKAAQIVDLLATTDLTREQIAEKVGCLPAYVRVVGQRLMAEPGNSPDRRWQKRNPDRQRAIWRKRMRRRRADPAFREKHRQYSFRYYHRKKAERELADA